jgi:aldehyde dehydrogenase (NAD+)
MSVNTASLDIDGIDKARRAFELQREYRWHAKQLSSAERKSALSLLATVIEDNRDELVAALHTDLGRSVRLSMTEIGSVLTDIDDAIQNLDSWVKPTLVAPAASYGPGARAEIRYEGRGVVLLFGPWNFPFGLVFQPLVAIVAAGNTCIVKPNELAQATSAVTSRIIQAVFDEKHVTALEGGVALAESLLELPVDHVFFTGSPAVGKKVMARAAEHLASVTLELGGKCPAVVDRSANLERAIAHIAFGKHQNSGQICLSPDHVWVHEAVRDEFIAGYVAWITTRLCKDGRLDVGKLGRMIDERNANRARAYVDDALRRGASQVFTAAADFDARVVPPMVLTDLDAESILMEEEIFSPIMPVLTFREPSTVIDSIRRGGKPLAMYVFSEDDAVVEQLIRETSSGGVTVNGWALHSSENQLPFGGVGSSGIGRYHGIHGFLELSHARSVFIASTQIG